MLPNIETQTKFGHMEIKSARFSCQNALFFVQTNIRFPRLIPTDSSENRHKQAVFRLVASQGSDEIRTQSLHLAKMFHHPSH